jgi:hypothetical protein
LFVLLRHPSLLDEGAGYINAAASHWFSSARR